MRSLLAKTFNYSIDSFGWMIGSIIQRRIKRNNLNFPFVAQSLSQIPFSFGWKLRRAVYARVLPRVGKDVVLQFGVSIEDERTSFGDDVWVSVGSYLDYVEIEDHVLIGPNAVLLSGGKHHHTERTDIPIKLQGNHPKTSIRIGRGAWIGANATVMADVGNDAIVGAGSVVTKPVPPFAVVVGNPAKVIRIRE